MTMTREEILLGLKNIAAGEGLYDDRKPSRKALILGEAIKVLEKETNTKSVTIKQLEEMYTKFEQKLWREREDVRGDDMIEVCYADQFLQDLLAEFGCWDDEVEE